MKKNVINNIYVFTYTEKEKKRLADLQEVEKECGSGVVEGGEAETEMGKKMYKGKCSGRGRKEEKKVILKG